MSTKVIVICLICTIGSGLVFLSRSVIAVPSLVLFFSKAGIVIGGGGALLVYLSRWTLGKNRTDTFLQNFLLLGVILLILIFLSEFLVRLIFQNITTTGDNRSYFSTQWKKKHLRLNSWRFREREFELLKSQGTYRIAVLGDSYAYGQGILEKERFSNLLEASLASKGNYEVLNFGRPGANTKDAIAILRNVVNAEPDFVLLQWTVNDAESTETKNCGVKRPPLIPFDVLRKHLHRSSALYYLVNQQWLTLLRSLNPSKNYIKCFHDLFADPQGKESQRYKSILEEFIELSEKQNVPMAIVLFPRLTSDYTQYYPYDFLHDFVLQVCLDKGTSCLDLRSRIAPYTKGQQFKSLWVNRFDAHPGALVNRLAAESILKEYSRMWLSKGMSR